MLNFVLGCVVGFLGGMVLYGALVVSAESGKHDATN
jgi:hypothetical protein